MRSQTGEATRSVEGARASSAPSLSVIRGGKRARALEKCRAYGIDLEKPRLADLEDVLKGRPADHELRSVAEFTRGLAGKGLRPNTRTSYVTGIVSFIEYAESHDLDVLPLRPGAVDLWITDLAYGRKLKVKTIKNHLAALNKAADIVGLPAPGRNDEVKRVMAGVCQELGEPQKQKDALLLEHLRKVLRTIREAEPLERVALALLIGAGVAPGSVHRWMREDITINDEGLVVDLPPVGRWVTERTTTTIRRQSDATVCPVVAVERLLELSGGVGPLFPGPKGDPLSRWAVRDRLRALGVEDLLGETGPRMRLSKQRTRAIIRLAAKPTVLEMRDAALVTTAFAGALRRVDMGRFRWGDVVDYGHHIVLLLPRSKTDQEAVGEDIVLETTEGECCPATAFRAWRDRVAEELGADPVRALPTAPVFFTVERRKNIGAQPLKPMSGHAVNNVVKQRIKSARVYGDFASHSCRAGFVTQGIEAGLTDQELMAGARMKTAETVHRYNRTHQRERNNQRRMGM